MKRGLILLALFFCLKNSVAQTRIIYFNTTNLTDSIRLNFTISAGVSCAGYEILKGSDSVQLNPVYAYPGTCGNVNFNESHSYTDFSPNRLTPNYYQVHIPPSDYSPVKRVDLAANFSNLLIFPQPVDDYLNITISNQKNYYYEIYIYDRFGRKAGSGNGNASDKITLNVSGFNEGVYVFYIIQASGTAYRGKFLKKPSYY